MDVSDTVTRPAPGRLALVQAFINTNDLDRGEDRLGTTDAAKNWFVSCGLLSAGARVGRRDLDRIIAVREALRALLAADRSSAPGRSHFGAREGRRERQVDSPFRRRRRDLP
jgi:hypothetical protein